MTAEKKSYKCQESDCKGKVGFEDISLWRTHMLLAHGKNYRKYSDYKKK